MTCRDAGLPLKTGHCRFGHQARLTVWISGLPVLPNESYAGFAPSASAAVAGISAIRNGPNPSRPSASSAVFSLFDAGTPSWGAADDRSNGGRNHIILTAIRRRQSQKGKPLSRPVKHIRNVGP